MALSDKAMLVRVHISHWTGRKFDRRISSEVNMAYNAKEIQARVNKELVPKTMIGPLNNLVATIRRYVNTQTSPWLDDGVRVLPASQYFAFLTKLDDWKSEFNQEVDNFCLVYDDYRRFKARAYAGAMYQSSDYPDVEEVRLKFHMDTQFMPVPTNADWRVETDAEQQSMLQEGLERQLAAAERQIREDMYQRVHAVVEPIYRRLATPDGRFRKTLFENAYTLRDLLGPLNIFDDPRIEELRLDLLRLSLNDPDQMREHKALRQSVADEAEDILNRIRSYTAPTEGDIGNGNSNPGEAAESEDQPGAAPAVFRRTGT